MDFPPQFRQLAHAFVRCFLRHTYDVMNYVCNLLRNSLRISYHFHSLSVNKQPRHTAGLSQAMHMQVIMP